LLTYRSGNGPREAGYGEAARSVHGDRGAAPGVAPVVAAVATTGGSPPSSSLTREALIQRVDDESLGGYGG
jgi:hypothetical protein